MSTFPDWMFKAALSITSKCGINVKRPSVGQRIDKQNVIYPQKRVLLGNERNELLTHAVTWILKTYANGKQLLTK